ncbi:hypothetical protein BDZ94DRAFT_1127426, partial [Collybia nuda]
ELNVTFYPPLYLQRRMWVLENLRAEGVTKVLDVGCGEGQLLAVLCQPAPWLTPPPTDILCPLPSTLSSSTLTPPSPTYNDEIPNLHPTTLVGIDLSTSDLAFAVQGTTPPQSEVNLDEGSDEYRSRLTNVGLRWEKLSVKVWKGGLEVVNEEFVDMECIVCTEVIEHLSPNILPAFAPTLLGIYHPRLFLVTTPSYTFNARFISPGAPASVRRGFLDPTARTDRIFRHSDHKFEWTVDEFEVWCHETAEEWGYEVQVSSIGRALEIDEWGRDEELGGATSVAIFRRRDKSDREKRGRDVLKALALESEAHELLAEHTHVPHPSAQKPKTLEEIGEGIRATMEGFREAHMRVEELWFERDIAILCGGWIELLVRAVEESEALLLKRDGDEGKTRQDRGTWVVELVGGVTSPKDLWLSEGDKSIDYIPVDWIPGEGEKESSEDEWGGSTDMEGDISWNGSDDEDDIARPESAAGWP